MTPEFRKKIKNKKRNEDNETWRYSNSNFILVNDCIRVVAKCEKRGRNFEKRVKGFFQGKHDKEKKEHKNVLCIEWERESRYRNNVS